MKRFCYYMVATVVTICMSGCSAAYWSGTSFEGDDMYDTHKTVVATPSTTSYAAYQRPDSYYQYQYTGEEGDTTLVVEPRYISSTFYVWDNSPAIESYAYYNPWWGYNYYDPFYYGHYGYYGWGYPYYNHYGWHRPRPIYVPKRTIRRNIVTAPSTSAPSSPTTSSSTRSSSSSSSSSNKSNRGQSVGTTTSGSYKRATTTFNSSSSSQSRSSSSSSSPSSSSSNSRKSSR